MSELNERMDALIEEVCANPDQKKRLLSKTFWGRLDVKKKTTQKVKLVKEYLVRNGITISLVYHEFGTEPKDEWLTLQYWQVPSPEDSWFEKMSRKVYENEQEVDVFFLTPLYKALGYQEEDFTFEYKVDLSDKAKSKRDRRKAVDLALFDGTDRAEKNLLVVCEAKIPDKPNSRPKLKNLMRAENDLKYYQDGLSTAKRFVATNGDLIRIYKSESTSIVLHLELHRSVFKENWHALYLSLGKPILVKEIEG